MDHHQIVIHLLTDDLISSKLLNALEEIGFDSSSHSTDLAGLVLKLTGFSDPDDSIVNWYVATCNQYLKKLDLFAPRQAYQEQALLFYVDLLVEKRTRTNILST